MPTSATGEGGKAQIAMKTRIGTAVPRFSGYTLLEMLVVVAVIAILSAAVLLAARGTSGDRRIEDEARRMHRVLQLLCDEAVVEGRYAGFGYAAGRYAGYELSPQGWRVVERAGPLRVHELRAGLSLREPGAERSLPPELPEKPQLLCAPTGEIGEHDLVLAPAGATSGWRVALDREGRSALAAWEAR